MKKSVLHHQNLSKLGGKFSLFRIIGILGLMLVFKVSGVNGQTTVTLGGLTTGTCPFNSTATWTTPPAGLSFSNITRGSGVTCSSVGNAITGTGFNGTLAANITANKWYTFSITSDASTSFTLNSLNVQAQVSNATGANYSVQYSIGGGSKTVIGTFTPTTSSVSYTVTPALAISVPVSSVLNIYIIPNNLTASGTTARVSNASSISVTATAATTTPTVTNTTPATSISATTATLAGNVTATGGASITDNGSVYSLTSVNAAPQISGSGVTQLATSSPSAGTGAFSNVISSTLSVNTQYSFNAYAINSIGTSYGTVSTFYTLANVPSAPTVNNPTTTSLDVAIGAGDGNPSSTEYAIQETGGNYVQAGGTLGASAVWQTSATWGTKTVTGLSASTLYTFKVKARNGSSVETAFGSTTGGTTSAASSPTISVSGTLSAVSTTYGTASSTPTSFSTSGAAMNSGITITPPTGFEISLSSDFSTTIGTNASPLIVGAAGTISSTNVYVRLAANASVAGSPYTGNIVLSSTGATSQTIATVSSNVSTAPLTITGLSASDKIYDRTATVSVSGIASFSGLVNGESFTPTGSVTWAFADALVGSGKIVSRTGTYAAPSSNYTLTQPNLTANITVLALTTSGSAAITSKTYDRTTSAIVTGLSLTNVISGDVVTIVGTYNDKTVNTSKAVTLSLSGADNANYSWTTPIGITGDITAATLTLTGAAVTSKAFDGTTAATITGTLSGIIAGDVVTLNGTGTFASSSVGSGIAVTSTSTLGGADAGNYTLTQPIGLTGNITAIPVTIAIQDFEASPSAPTWIYTGGGATNTTTNKYNGAASYRISGSQTLTMNNLDISNYSNVSLSVAYAGDGPDSGEDLFMDISYDNSATWVGTGSVKLVDGFSNTSLNINTVNLSGPTTQASNPWTTSISGSETQISVRFRINTASSATEYYFIDDVKVTGLLNTSPIIFVSKNSISSFSQTSSTPSTEQTYTVSGNNLTGNVSITPPTGFEISTTTGGSFSATNPIVLTQSGGDLVGEPVTIYVRQNASILGNVSGNITHSSTGATNVNIALSGSRTGTYYFDGSGDLDVLTNWGLNTDGSGTNPSNFTTDGAIYEIRNASTATIGANWTVSGSSSKVVIGDGINATDFTIPSGFTLTGTVDISNASELTIENTTTPTFGTFASNSTLEYNNVAVTLALSNVLTYKNLKLSGTGTKTFAGHATNTTAISGNLTLNGTTIDGSGSSPFSTILLSGDLTYVGTVTPPIDGNSITLSTNGTAAGTQTFTGAGNTLRWFRITTTTANTLLLSTSGGSSNVLLGNATSGGLTLFDGSILNMNGNDFQLFNGGASFILGTTGSISTSSFTDFNIERTTSGSLGTIRFTSGSNTIGNLTLNHVGTTNTLTIGNALNVTGIITLTDGNLATNGFVTLKSSSTGTASIAALGSGATINGNITVERFIPAATTGRKYRNLAAPFSSGPTISSSWQQQIYITGSGSGGTACPSLTAHSNGFDASTYNNGSMLTFNEATATPVATTPNISGATVYTNAWTSVANTGSTNLTAGTGYNVYIRGNRSQGCGLLDGTNNSPIDVTLSATGAVKTGDHSFAITYNALNGDGWNLIGNPYPSAIDWDQASWTKTNVLGTIWIFDPANDRYATYVTGSGGTNGGSNIIASGQAFFVKANAASPILSVTEAAKTNSAAANLFKGNKPFEIKLTLSNSNNKSDEHLILLNRNKTDLFDQDADAEKMGNASGVNIYSYDVNTKKYAINSIANIDDNQEREIPLGIGSAAQGSYSIKIESLSLPNFYNVFLVDKYTHTETQFINGEPMVTTFTASADTASFGNNRFSLWISNNRPHSTGLYSEEFIESTISIYPNPSNSSISISTNSKYISSLKLFTLMGKELLVIENPMAIEQVDLSKFDSGIYILQAEGSNGKQKIIKVIKN